MVNERRTDDRRMSDPVARQYEAYPYPARDPADERKRLITGSPSHPVEIDHFLFKGARDWRAPFRALVAGGGTGDGLIMLAQMLAARGTPAEIHYLDMSRASRAVAEARAAERGLASITFHSGDLLTAPELGPFDYIDCCGVLHHLPEPQAGFDALAKALAPEGGIGCMVYAPYGRAGVYELQAALRPLVEGLEPADQVAVAKAMLKTLPETNAFARNALMGDHHDSDAGLYDLLLHSRDTPYDVPRLLETLATAGLKLAGFTEPARYRPATYLRDAALATRAEALPEAERMALAERLAGNIKAHVFYAVPEARGDTVAKPSAPTATPALHRIDRRDLATTIARRRRLKFSVDGLSLEWPVDKALADLAARIDGRADLAGLQRASGLDWMAFSARFAALHEPLDGFNLLRFSSFAKG